MMNDDDMPPGETLRLPVPYTRGTTGGPAVGRGDAPSSTEGPPDRLAQQQAASLARGLLNDRYRNLLTAIEFRPFELWIVAEALRLGMGHPSFSHAGAEMSSPDIWDMAKRLWAACHDRLKDLDPNLAEAMPRPR